MGGVYFTGEVVLLILGGVLISVIAYRPAPDWPKRRSEGYAALVYCVAHKSKNGPNCGNPNKVACRYSAVGIDVNKFALPMENTDTWLPQALHDGDVVDVYQTQTGAAPFVLRRWLARVGYIILGIFYVLVGIGNSVSENYNSEASAGTAGAFFTVFVAMALTFVMPRSVGCTVATIRQIRGSSRVTGEVVAVQETTGYSGSRNRSTLSFVSEALGELRQHGKQKVYYRALVEYSSGSIKRRAWSGLLVFRPRVGRRKTVRVSASAQGFPIDTTFVMVFGMLVGTLTGLLGGLALISLVFA